MPFLESFNPFVDKVPEWPMRKLDQISWRASRKLTQFALVDLRRYARQIDDAIHQEKELYVETETERYIDSLLEHGGWELSHFPGDPEEITRTSIAWLLNNWPSDLDEQPSLPKTDDLSDLDALQQALDYDHFQSPFNSLELQRPFSSGEALSIPLFALFCLMKVEEAVEALGWSHDSKFLSRAESNLLNLAAAADAAIEAMDALDTVTRYETIERERRQFQRNQADSVRRQQEVEVMHREAERRSRRAASAERALLEKNARFAAAQDWIWDEWQQVQTEYAGNRMAFARTYVRLVADRFTTADGRPMMISERTIWERWTKAPRIRRET